HARRHRLQVEASAGEELAQGDPLGRRLGVKRELGVDELDLVRPDQPVSTDRTEVAPGSDVVGEDLQADGAHGAPSLPRIPEGRAPATSKSRIGRTMADRLGSSSKSTITTSPMRSKCSPSLGT